jgi:hypothetical protein
VGQLRDATGRFRPGQTGNAGGRPKGLAATVREATDLDGLLAVLLGIIGDATCRAADRIRAAELLLDRGWGKAPTYQPIADGDPLEQTAIDAAIVSLIAQLRGRPTQRPESN